MYYSQNSLIQTPKGQNQVLALQRCPSYRGRECLIFGFSGTKRTVRKERLHSVLTFHSLQRTSVAPCIYCKNYLTLIMILLIYVPLMKWQLKFTKLKNIEDAEDLYLLLELTQRACFLVIAVKRKWRVMRPWCALLIKFRKIFLSADHDPTHNIDVNNSEAFITHSISNSTRWLSNTHLLI